MSDTPTSNATPTPTTAAAPAATTAPTPAATSAPTPTAAPAPAPSPSAAPTAPVSTQKPAAAAPVASVKPLSDWVNVRLSAEGVTMAGVGGVVHVANAHMSYKFTGTAPQRVLRVAEWTKVLSTEIYQGKPVFELVPAPLPAATT